MLAMPMKEVSCYRETEPSNKPSCNFEGQLLIDSYFIKMLITGEKNKSICLGNGNTTQDHAILPQM